MMAQPLVGRTVVQMPTQGPPLHRQQLLRCHAAHPSACGSSNSTIEAAQTTADARPCLRMTPIAKSQECNERLPNDRAPDRCWLAIPWPQGFLA